MIFNNALKIHIVFMLLCRNLCYMFFLRLFLLIFHIMISINLIKLKQIRYNIFFVIKKLLIYTTIYFIITANNIRKE